MLGGVTLHVETYQWTQVRYFGRQCPFLAHPGALIRIIARQSQIPCAPRGALFLARFCLVSTLSGGTQYPCAEHVLDEKINPMTSHDCQPFLHTLTWEYHPSHQQ